MTTWDTAQAAVHAWIVAASQLTADQVLFAQQDSDEDPAGPWISVDLTSARGLGLDWRQHSFDPDADPGEEVTTYHRGTRQLELTIQAFDGSAVGTSSPRSVLMNFVDRARLSSAYSLLRAAGVGLLEISAVTPIGAIKNSSHFEPRAVVRVTLYITSEVSETAGKLERVDITAVAPIGGEDDPITDAVIAFITPPLE